MVKCIGNINQNKAGGFMNTLALALKKLRESRGLTQAELAKRSGIASGTVGEIEAGNNRSTVKTLNKIAIALALTSEEKNELDSAFLGRKVAGTQDPRAASLNKKDRNQLEDLLSESSLFFNDEKISDEDKKKFLDSLTEIYFANKHANK